MRVVKSFSDVNAALRELYDFRDKFSAKTVDWGGRRLANVGKATDINDAVILSQLPTITTFAEQKVKDQIYTIAFSKDSVLTDLNLAPAFTIGKGKEGIPIEVWINCETAPVGGPCICNPTFNGITILQNPIQFPTDATGPVFSSGFVDPVPIFGSQGKVLPGIITANGAALFSMGVVVKTVQRTL